MVPSGLARAGMKGGMDLCEMFWDVDLDATDVDRAITALAGSRIDAQVPDPAPEHYPLGEGRVLLTARQSVVYQPDEPRSNVGFVVASRRALEDAGIPFNERGNGLTGEPIPRISWD
jgi:hypothetical protein